MLSKSESVVWLHLREVELSIGVVVDVVCGSRGGVELPSFFPGVELSIGVVIRAGSRFMADSGVVVSVWLSWVCSGILVGCSLLKSKCLSQSIDMWLVTLQRLHLIVGHLQ